MVDSAVAVPEVAHDGHTDDSAMAPVSTTGRTAGANRSKGVNHPIAPKPAMTAEWVDAWRLTMSRTVGLNFSRGAVRKAPSYRVVSSLKVAMWVP
jgi:hypothetical protein